MVDRSRRRELTAEYRRTLRDAGVYLIRCAPEGRALLATSVDLASDRNKLEFARKTGMTGVFDRRLRPAVERHGVEALSFEVLEVLDIQAGATRRQIVADLGALEELWRERIDPATLYD